MDITKQYIKMCRKAGEIQPQDRGIPSHSPFKDGDMFALGHKVTMYDGCSHSEGFIEPEIYNPKCVWLPRQDQLQEMVVDNSLERPWVHLCYQFYKWAHLNWNDFTSMEQLWLAFVMKEKYHKIWTGEGWIKDGN